MPDIPIRIVVAIESQVETFVAEVETKGGAAVKEVVAEVKATEAKVKKATKEVTNPNCTIGMFIS